MFKKAGFGGGCHWCTEAVFLALKGVSVVEQGWIAPKDNEADFSEAVIVVYDRTIIPFETLIAVHLYTHSCTSEHSMRGKYRSAVYTFNDEDIDLAENAISSLQRDFDAPLITTVIPFGAFRLNKEEQLNYYFSDPGRPFCETYINPKLKRIREQFSGITDTEKLRHL